jgi:hypothetical protein
MTAVAGDASAFVSWNPIPDGGAPIQGGMLSLAHGSEQHDVWFTGTPQPTVVTGLTNGVTYQTFLTVWTDRGWGYTGATGPPVTPQAGATLGARYHPLAPTRVLDSRGPNGGWNAHLTAGSPRDLQVTGLGGATSVPATASAVVLNVTATNATAGSFLSVWPTGSPQPVSSNLNFAAGETIANLVTVKVGAGEAAVRQRRRLPTWSTWSATRRRHAARRSLHQHRAGANARHARVELLPAVAAGGRRPARPAAHGARVGRAVDGDGGGRQRDRDRRDRRVVPDGLARRIPEADELQPELRGG